MNIMGMTFNGKKAADLESGDGKIFLNGKLFLEYDGNGSIEIKGDGKLVVDGKEVCDLVVEYDYGK